MAGGEKLEMAVIVPTITTADRAIFDKNLQDFAQFSKRIQIDASDGTFAATTMVGLADMEFPVGLQIDLHLMTAKPSDYLQRIIELKPSLCIVHLEVDDDLMAIAQSLHGAGIKFGLALLKGTFPRRAEQLVSEADHMMIFSGSLGEQGGQADLLQYEKVPIIRELKQDIEIGWDGGANLSNVRALAHAGIDVVNVGSAITGAPDPAAMYKAISEEAERKGVLV